jgi:signal transduction histidine kinase
MRFTKTYFSKNLSWGLIIGLIVIIGTTLFLANRVYRIAFQETKASQGAQQLEMARAASLGIQYFLKHLSKDLHLFASFPYVQYLEMDILNSKIDDFYQHTNLQAVKRIFVVDRYNNLVCYRGGPLPPWLMLLLQKRISAAKTDYQQKGTWYSRIQPFQRGNTSSVLYLAMLVPIVQNFKDKSHPNPSNEFVGMVGYLVDFDWLMQQFIKSIHVGQTGFAWVMDQYGRLLYHPRHPEMILRSIYSEEPECRRCHTSFNKQAALIHNQFIYEEYQVGKEPAKIMAQAPMTVSNKKWIIVVSIDLAEVTAIMRKNFQLFFWLVGLALTSIILGGILLMFFNIRRVHAEAHAQRSEEKRVLQEQIYQASKLASIGELVDSVAHEINTPVGIISAQVDAMLLDAKNQPTVDILNIIKDQTCRIANYTKSLLRFSRRMKFQPKSTDLIDMTEECLRLVEPRLRANRINVKKKWPKNLPPVMMDRNQMQQVLLNLLNNSVDALNDEGEISVTIETINGENGNAGVKIIVADNGHGINPESMSKIFDPFFTTKPSDKGTGLGLAISQAIVKRHGGWIKAESEEGKGAIFIMFIPFHKT